MSQTVVSIHAPTRGATLLPQALNDINSCFNPRTHTGCDVGKEVQAPTYWGVSIHAPTRGATAQHADLTVSPLFQSTHPHGVRLKTPCSYA